MEYGFTAFMYVRKGMECVSCALCIVHYGCGNNLNVHCAYGQIFRCNQHRYY